MNPLGQEPGQHSPVIPNGAINEHGVLRIHQILMFAQKPPQPLSITAAKIEVGFLKYASSHRVKVRKMSRQSSPASGPKRATRPRSAPGPARQVQRLVRRRYSIISATDALSFYDIPEEIVRESSYGTCHAHCEDNATLASHIPHPIPDPIPALKRTAIASDRTDRLSFGGCSILFALSMVETPNRCSTSSWQSILLTRWGSSRLLGSPVPRVIRVGVERDAAKATFVSKNQPASRTRER